MSDRIEAAFEEVRLATEQIFKGSNGGGYHLCEAVNYLASELFDIRAMLAAREEAPK